MYRYHLRGGPGANSQLYAVQNNRAGIRPAPKVESFDCEVGKLQQELLHARLIKLHGGFAVLTGTFDIRHGTFPEALMHDDVADLQRRG